MSTITKHRIVDGIALLVFGIAIGVVTLAFLLQATAPAYSQPDPVAEVWTQPYGGCDEAWSYPNSIGAAECAEHGFLPVCRNEDRGRLCSWNVGRPASWGLDLWYDAAGVRHYL